MRKHKPSPGKTAAALALVALIWPLGAGAGDHDRAREARERGDIKPLEDILPGISRLYPGDIVKVELEREDGRWIYEIKLIGKDGRLVKLDVDARSAEIIEAEGR
ncbi:MAG: PepSY domain-containing protein [Parvibaculum sp.]|uniref:PepSY domain-containing protein n=1 Tax=Parvibaculum sp. TaxID=2024848 RepID=UPI003C766470